MSTCENRGKAITKKSLNYTHCVICPQRSGITRVDDDVPEQAPPKQKLERSVTVVEPIDNVKPRAKAKPRAKKVTVTTTPPDVVPERPKRPSKAAARAEKYEQMAAQALP